MAKTSPPNEIKIPGAPTAFATNALPDPFDKRDLEYRPRLEPLPSTIDQRSPNKEDFILQQEGHSCTGHAVAAVINTVLTRIAQRKQIVAERKRDPAIVRVSPYMLYRLARRYDEFPGEAESGSSLRGAFKGWFYHGVALEAEWPRLEMDSEPDLDDPDFINRCRERPLGAFYRVNPYRLDDMQSAISELHTIAVSAAIHEGWANPVVRRRGRDWLDVIERPVNAKALGGHAFVLAGYNEVGFLVQNSWGPTWGKGGYATLPYDDWLDNAYDAWVARPGVPQTPFAAGRTRTASSTGGDLSTAPGPDLKRLGVHVVNLGNDGLLSTTGKFVSTPLQIEKIFEHMGAWHDFWEQKAPGQKRHIVLYAHGGLVSESGGLITAQRHLNWWLNNRIYPIYFAWESGPIETLFDQLGDNLKGKLPMAGIGFDFIEQVDRLVEKMAGANFRWAWDQMKQNARAASDPIVKGSPLAWPPAADASTMARLPGASLTVSRLAEYIAKHPAAEVAVHLVGHSAGSIFHAGLLQRLAEAKITVDSMALLAPGLRVDEFRRDVLPLIGTGKTVQRFAIFDLSDQRELDDVCGAAGINVYHKSLLYLVSRALERPSGQRPQDTFEVPLLGMQKFLDGQSAGGEPPTLEQQITMVGGAVFFSPQAALPDGRTDALGHGSFTDDAPTMTSVVMRALDTLDPAQVRAYQPNAALADADGAQQVDAPLVAVAPTAARTRRRPATQPLAVAAEANAPGETPLIETAAPQTQAPTAPPQPGKPVIEVAVAPRSPSPIGDVLDACGWTKASRRKRGLPNEDKPARKAVKQLARRKA